MNSSHRIRKARKYNHIWLLENNLFSVPHTNIILVRIIESLLNEVIAGITQTLTPLLYFLISPNYLTLTCLQARLV